MTQTEYVKFIANVKETIKKQPIPPDYNQSEWKGLGVNCYLYAMRARMDFSDISGSFVRPGFLAEKEKNEYKYEKKFVLENFRADCKALDLNVCLSSLEEHTGEGEYKIAVYVAEDYDFHFRRQNSNGEWSEVNGWYGQMRCIKPESITQDDDDYKFCGIFKVSKK